jgi:N-acetylglucosaminyldiphosphoundecaprenol N-acetyl-beta-D-mannosaminyltransferase
MKRLEIFNLYLSPYSNREIIRRIDEYLLSKEYHYQVSINVNKLVECQQNIKLKKVLNNADISNADGMPIKWYAKLKYGINIPRMGGLDYMDICAERFPDKRYFFLGATDGVLSKVVKYYREKYHLNIVGYRNGYFPREEEAQVVEHINSCRPHFLFIAVGTPQKEYFLYENRDRLKVCFAIGVGGAFDIIAGKIKRAPAWMQDIGFEWLWRLSLEPRRLWKRYAISNSKFIYYLVRDIICK